VLEFFSNLMIPLLFFYIVGMGLIQKVKVYDCFVKGAKEGMQVTWQIFPTLLGLMTGVGVLRASGFFTWLGEWLAKFLAWTGLPEMMFPLIFVRMFSTSAANALVFDLFKEFGTDSLEGMMASIMMACTESVFYTMSMYFMAVKITKTRWTLAGALVSTLAGVVASIVLAGWMVVG